MEIATKSKGNELSTIVVGIRRSIEERGLQQKFVAQRSGFTEQQFSAMLNGRKVIRAEYLPLIANAIGTDIPELYKAGTNST